MSSSFVSHHTHYLATFTTSICPSSNSNSPSSPTKEALLELSLSLKPPISIHRVRDVINTLKSLNADHGGASVASRDEEEEQLQAVVLGKLVVGMYAETLDTFLNEASDVEKEAQWWAEVERSRYNLLCYLVQTLPIRLKNVAKTILSTFHARNIPLNLSTLSPSSLRALFPAPSSFRPSALTISLFPHLRTQPHVLAITLHGDDSKERRSRSHLTWPRLLWTITVMPLELTRHECHTKRRALERLRDERAKSLGELAALRPQLANSLKLGNPNIVLGFVEKLYDHTSKSPKASNTDLLSSISEFANSTLPAHTTHHITLLHASSLLRPSRLVQIWPRILLFPPLTLYAMRKLSASRTSLKQLVDDARETAIGFVRDWLFEPLKGVLETVKSGGEQGVIVSREGIEADIASLERMTLALAQDKLHYTPAQLTELSTLIRAGDLTPVLRIYEADIKSPLASALGGTLLRSVFVQVQKAKVDVGHALAGIDRLLKSQELTFAFVGVAPAFAVVYVLGGVMRRTVGGASGRGRFGGRKRRAGAWDAVRRVERLLLTPPAQGSSSQSDPNALTPLTQGLLLLALTHLRAYALTCLPPYSRLREGFLEDVQDLEDPEMGRREKVEVVGRMWRCWGQVLGWGKLADTE